MNTRRAWVIGHSGQDGYYLCRLLSERGYHVVGTDSRHGWSSTGQMTGHVPLSERAAVAQFVADWTPDEIYYLAAHHHSSEDVRASAAETLRRSFQVHVMDLMNVLEAVVVHSPTARLFYAASSHVFGAPSQVPQTESTPFDPICEYGISKTAAIQTIRFVRQTEGLLCKRRLSLQPRIAAAFIQVREQENCIRRRANLSRASGPARAWRPVRDRRLGLCARLC